MLKLLLQVDASNSNVQSQVNYLQRLCRALRAYWSGCNSYVWTVILSCCKNRGFELQLPCIGDGQLI